LGTLNVIRRRRRVHDIFLLLGGVVTVRDRKKLDDAEMSSCTDGSSTRKTY
jgi:hypothetical protein